MLEMETLPNYQQLETYVSGIQKNTVIVLANTSHLASSSFIPNAFCCSVTIYNGESDFHGLLTTAASVNNFWDFAKYIYRKNGQSKTTYATSA